MRCVATLLLLLWSTSLWADVTPKAAPRFRSIEVIVDPAGSNLAAYQIEIFVRGDAQIVGVEGGEHPAFNAAPYYDPAALNQGRIIIAAFSTATDVPSKTTRVVTLHVREQVPGPVEYEAKSVTAANTHGTAINVVVSLRHQGAPQ